jgi:hypothetical protein
MRNERRRKRDMVKEALALRCLLFCYVRMAAAFLRAGEHAYIVMLEAGTPIAGLMSDCTVWAWATTTTALGQGDSTNADSPCGWRASPDELSSRERPQPRLKSDGTVWAWGDNYFAAWSGGLRG